MKSSIHLTLVFTLLGLGGGWVYWFYLGCTEGCAITGSWYGSSLMGGIFGHLVGGILLDFFKSN